MASLLAAHLKANPVPGDVIVPVPLHPRRLRSRGYNQAGLLARGLGKLAGLPVHEGLLARTRDTPPQVQAASRDERRNNVSGTFRCAGDVQGRAIVLVDDVVTTGSTMSACAAVLKTAGAVSVWGMAVAREG